MKNPIRTPAARPEITAQNIPLFWGISPNIKAAEPTADRIELMYVPLRSEPRRFF